MLALLLPLLSSLSGGLGAYFKQRNDIQMQQLSNQLAMEAEKAKLIAQGMVVDGERNIEQIKATSSWFKQFIYCVMLCPIVITCVSPATGAAVFASLQLVPEWYMGLITTIGLAMWGINSDKLQAIIQGRREYKLEKLKINRKAFFDGLRKSKGFVTPDDVKQLDAALDEADKGA